MSRRQPSWKFCLFNNSFHSIMIQRMAILMSTHNILFLWRTDENYPSIITKYPPYLFHWTALWILKDISVGELAWTKSLVEMCEASCASDETTNLCQSVLIISKLQRIFLWSYTLMKQIFSDQSGTSVTSNASADSHYQEPAYQRLGNHSQELGRNYWTWTFELAHEIMVLTT